MMSRTPFFPIWPCTRSVEMTNVLIDYLTVKFEESPSKKKSSLTDLTVLEGCSLAKWLLDTNSVLADCLGIERCCFKHGH